MQAAAKAHKQLTTVEEPLPISVRLAGGSTGQLEELFFHGKRPAKCDHSCIMEHLKPAPK